MFRISGKLKVKYHSFQTRIRRVIKPVGVRGEGGGVVAGGASSTRNIN